MGQPLRSPLCDLLGIRYPIAQAPMAGGATTPELVAAVSEAGGFGGFGAARMPPDALRAAIRRAQELTDRPFCVNFLVAPPEDGNKDVAAMQVVLDRLRAELGLPPGPREVALPPSVLQQQLEVVFEERVPVVSFALGDPAPFVGHVHDAGALAAAMVTTVEEAVRVVGDGVDIVVAQGGEAGGHRSTLDLGPFDEPPLVGTLPLVAQVVDAVGVPVIATGGIADGRGVVAALALGAAGAQLGTRFLVARESGVPETWKERLLAATEADTVLTRRFTGRPARGLRNRLVREQEAAGVPPLAWPFQSLAAEDLYRAAQQEGVADFFPLLSGQGLRLLKPDQGAAEIVAELVAEAGEAIARLERLRTG